MIWGNFVKLKILTQDFLNLNFCVKIIAGFLILVIWQVGVALFAANFVARPLNIMAVFPDVITDKVFIEATGATLSAVIEGLFIALIAGTIIGVAMGRVKFFDRLLNVYINGFYTMPMVAALPLLTIWFGDE